MRKNKAFLLGFRKAATKGAARHLAPVLSHPSSGEVGTSWDPVARGAIYRSPHDEIPTLRPMFITVDPGHSRRA